LGTVPNRKVFNEDPIGGKKEKRTSQKKKGRYAGGPLMGEKEKEREWLSAERTIRMESLLTGQKGKTERKKQRGEAKHLFVFRKKKQDREKTQSAGGRRGKRKHDKKSKKIAKTEVTKKKKTTWKNWRRGQKWDSEFGMKKKKKVPQYPWQVQEKRGSNK